MLPNQPTQNIPVQPPPNPLPPVPPQTQTFSPIVPPKKKSKLLVILAIILIVFGIVFAAYNFLVKPKSSTSNEIVWWGLWENQSTVQPLITAYESAHPDVKIIYKEQSKEDYRERLTNALAKGEGPDIFTFHNTWVPMFKSDLDALPSSVMTAADYSKNFYPVILSDLSYGNSIVGLPIGYDALTLYINQDIFDKAGKTPPTEWNDLRSLAKELTIKDDSGTIVQSGVALGNTENVDHWQEILALMMIQNGVDLSNPIGKNAEGALAFFTLFTTSDGVWDTTLPSSTQAFAAGKLAMYFAPSWEVFRVKELNPELNFKTVPVPQVPKDDANEPDVSYATYWAQGVWAKSSKKIAAWNFLNYLTTQESLSKLYQGESAVRSFGEAYPRVDMASLLLDHPILGSIISQASVARSWYLASRTFDGKTGINTQISNYFGDAVNAVSANEKTVTEALETASVGIAQVLAQYGISVK